MQARGAVAAGVLLVFAVGFIILGFTNRTGIMLAAILAPTQVEPS